MTREDGCGSGKERPPTRRGVAEVSSAGRVRRRAPRDDDRGGGADAGGKRDGVWPALRQEAASPCVAAGLEGAWHGFGQLFLEAATPRCGRE